MKEKVEQAMDFVITWVDGSDPNWLQERERYKSNIYMDDSMIRYRDLGTLKYLLRSIEKFAPWVGKIFLVTSGQVPKWLTLGNPKLKLVKHSDFIPEKYLPTFNPQTIEWHLHKIEGLSENFVYFNDDVILTDYVKPSDFFKNDMPCDTFALGMVKPVELFSHTAFNNIYVINKHFDFKETIKKNRKKFFSLKYGELLLRTSILSTRPVFYGMYEPHITLALKKSYFDILWQKESDLIIETCKNKFRTQNDITIWLVRYWQMLSGNFMPRTLNFGKCYTASRFMSDKKVEKILIKRKRKVICINDSPIDALDVLNIQKKIKDKLDIVLSAKSSFGK